MEDSKPKNKNLVIVIAVLAVVLVAILAAMVLMGEGGGESEDETLKVSLSNASWSEYNDLTPSLGYHFIYVEVFIENDMEIGLQPETYMFELQTDNGHSYDIILSIPRNWCGVLDPWASPCALGFGFSIPETEIPQKVIFTFDGKSTDTAFDA